MMWQRIVPFLIILLVALLILALVMYQLRKSRDIERKERLQARKNWDGNCQFDNPETGAKCQREEFHLENHYRDVKGKLVHWP